MNHEIFTSKLLFILIANHLFQISTVLEFQRTFYTCNGLNAYESNKSQIFLLEIIKCFFQQAQCEITKEQNMSKSIL